MKRGSGLVWSVTVVAGLASAPVWAGVAFETQGARGNKTATWAEGQKLRVEQDAPGAPQRVVLVDGTARTVTLLNSKTKTFTRMELDKLKAMGDAANQRMEQALANLTPEQRAKIQGAVKKENAPSGAYALAPLGKKEQVAGHTCEWYRASQGEKAIAETCFIPFASLGLTRDELIPTLKLVETLREIGARFGQPEVARTDPDKAPGFPAIHVTLTPSGERKDDLDRLVKVEKLAVPAARFDVPAGYTAQAGGPTR